MQILECRVFSVIKEDSYIEAVGNTKLFKFPSLKLLLIDSPINIVFQSLNGIGQLIGHQA
ncbi:hypothetical protein T10_2953 [Trichinella papuae]|uniref:Uncharacterized protein n=1 Tax=Trichinella papuae TaxID=268474 RepID=A0A0V1MJV9_9BILA|nr:hypothetical protein T10_2953 [Trichinella papuae]